MKLISKLSFALLSILIFSIEMADQAQAQSYDSALFNSSKKELKVLRITPDGNDVPVNSQQIVFKFNQAVVPIGDMTRNSEDIPVDIQPQVNCQWLWLDTSSLSCQLNSADQLALSTRYEITLNTGLETVDSSVMSQAYKHSFITQRPKLENIYLWDWDRQHKPVAYLYFNQAVSKSSIEKHIQLTSDDGQVIAVNAERDSNPFTDSYFRQANSDSEFIELEAIPIFGPQENRHAIVEKAQTERSGAYDEARDVWKLAPAEDLPTNSRFSVRISPGIKSIYGNELGVQDLNVHQFWSLPEFEFIGVKCHTIINNDVLNLEPLFSTSETLRTIEGGIENASIKECDPLNSVSLMFSTPVSYAKAKTSLTFLPDLANGRSDYDPWSKRNDSYALQYFYQRRFNQGDRQPYEMRLPEQLKAFEQYRVKSNQDFSDQFGRTAKAAVDMSFLTSHRAPRLHIDHNHSVLEKNMQTELPIVITNLDALTLENYTLTTATERKNVESFNSPIANVQDIAYRVPLGVREALNNQSGIVVGAIASDPPPTNYRPDNYRVISQVTPFHVHFKFGHFNSYAWVTDLSTGKPVADALVKLEVDNYSSIEPFGEQVGAVKTDADGVAILPGSQQIDPYLKHTNYYSTKHDRVMLKVVKDDDFAVLPLDNYYRSWPQLSHRLADKGSYRHAWGTTAQGVYKAGDTIQYKLWVRDQNNQHWVAAENEGYTLEITDPKGQRVEKIENLSLSKFGGFNGELTTSESASVGWYSFTLSYNNGGRTKSLNPLRVLVSDFTPSPFRVSNDLNGDQFQAGDTISIDTLAKLHAGGPYADAEARVSAELKARVFSSKHPEAKGFSFNHAAGLNSQAIHQSNGALDKTGLLKSEISLNDYDLHFGRISIESAVRDDRGKYVATSSSADYLGRDRFVGLRNTNWVHNVGKKVSIEHLVVDPNGEPAKGTDVLLNIERYVTKAARVKGAGNAYLTQYTSEWVATHECKQTSTLRKQSCSFTPKEPGSYRIIANIEDTKGRKTSSTLSTWVVGEGIVLWTGANSNAIEIVADAESYKVGDVAKFLVKNPYPNAEALITVERYGVKRHWRQTLEGSTPIIEVPIEDNDYPGIYLSVVITSPRVAQPLGDGKVDLGKPTFKMGYAAVAVKDVNKEIEVKVKTNRKVYKPRDEVSLQIKAKPRTGDLQAMEVAVVVLDEAVFDLNISGEAYYDPYQGFNKLKPLGIANYNLLMNLIGRQKFEKKGANAGGGGGADDGASLRNLKKFVAYWNPSIELDSKGRATLDFELPDNLTGWRVFAMAVTEEEKMGLGDVNFKVNRPTELRPVMPNQLTEGDQVQAGFSVMNRTKKARTLNVELRAAGSALSEPVVKTLKVKLDAFERKRLWLPIKTDNHGELAFLAKAGDALDKDALEHHVSVAKRRSLLTAATYGTTSQASVSENFAYPDGIYTDVGGLSVEVSPSVIGNISGAFEYLKDYPYACWEQRLSRGLAASQFTKLKDYLPDDLEWQNSAELPAQTLASAASFQAPSGGMTYWINNDLYVSPYLSAYTALGFSWLKQQGHVIPKDVEVKLHDYLKSYLRKDEQIKTPTGQSSRQSKATIRAVALAALAANGEIDKNELLRYQPHLPYMDLFGKAHYLQASVALDVEQDKIIEQSQTLLSHSVQSGGKFQFSEEVFYGASSIHTTAMRSNCAILTSLLKVSAVSEESLAVVGDIPFKQVRSIAQTRGGRDFWASTQENLFCLNALINYSEVYENVQPKMQISAASVTEKYAKQSIGETAFDDLRDTAVVLTNPELAIEPGLSGKLELNKQGDGRVYYKMLMRYATTEENSARINAGIEVKREYSVQREGKWQLIQSPMQLEKGELVRVDIFLSSPAARQFIVVDDPIPGGLEPVNRDLATASSVDAAHSPAENSHWFSRNSWNPYGFYGRGFYHKELRHDSARFFSDYLPNGDYHLSYTAQAIAGGMFSVLPLKVEEMYDPDVYGLGLPASLEVAPAIDE